MSKIRLPPLIAIAAILPGVAGAQSGEPDLAALVECRGTVQDWGAVAFRLMEGPAAAEAMGWTERTSDNPFLKEYDLAVPVSVFGRRTRHVAVTATGPMAVLENVDPATLAAEFGVTPLVSTPAKFLGEKVVVESSETSGGARFDTRISLNVSTIDTHPGATFAGCSYSVQASSAE